jgi:DNA primase catalytic core
VSELEKRQDVAHYLHTRGVSDETKKLWRLGFAPAHWQDVSDHLVKVGFTKDEVVEAGLASRSEKKPGEVYDRFRGRVMFPICDAQGRVIAFSGRFFEKVEGSREDGEPAKYVNSPETALFKKSRVLYGMDKAKSAIRKADCILLVEGQFDLILAHQSGLPFTVALSGTALTPEHLSLLGRLSKRLVLALDADQAGIRSGLKSALMAIEAGFDVKIPTFPQGKDPADVARENPEHLKAAVRTSQTAVEFFLEVLRPGAKDERVYKKAVEAQVLPLVSAMGSKIEQEHFVRIIAGKLSVSESAVREEVAKRKITRAQTAEPDLANGPRPPARLRHLRRDPQSLPNIETDVDFLEELYEKFLTAHIDVLEGGGMLEIEPECPKRATRAPTPVRLYPDVPARDRQVPAPQRAERARLGQAHHRGDDEARNLLARANLRLVVSIAKKYVGRSLTSRSLTSSRRATSASLRPSTNSTTPKGFKFSTYATWWIRQAITRALGRPKPHHPHPRAHGRDYRQVQAGLPPPRAGPRPRPSCRRDSA